MNPLPAPVVPGKTEAQRFNNALRKVLGAPKRVAIKTEVMPQPKAKGRKTMKALAMLLFLAVAASAQDHQTMVNEHGDHVMGFSHENTTHHFELNYGGGVIDVRVNDVRDTKSRDEIRNHFRHIAQMFADGNFNAPALIHGTNVPGTATMARLKDQLHWDLQDSPRGARIVITADNKESLDALHDFLRFQIEDHKTGDCPMIR